MGAVTMFGGWYVLGFRRDGAVLAVVAGPWQDRGKAQQMLPAAQKAALARFSIRDTDTFTVGQLYVPEKTPGKCNAELWVNPEWNAS